MDFLIGRYQRRPTVSWDASWPEVHEQADEHEMVIDFGCFGHVCPPWLAPQFLVVSAAHSEAVAANDVALQHYGRKVVWGHVTTTSGRQILIHIKFDVMSVRKPLLSTSALKHRRVNDHFQSRSRPHHFSERDSEFGVT